MKVAPPLSDVRITASTPPLFITSWYQDISITLEKRAAVSEVVDTRIFDGLRSDITNDQAEKQLGRPRRSWVDSSGTWSEYPNAWGTVEIGCERPQSVPDEGTCNWRVCARPIGGPATILRRPILDQLEDARKMIPRAKYRNITLWRWDHVAMLNVLIEEDHAIRMQLLARIPSDR